MYLSIQETLLITFAGNPHDKTKNRPLVALTRDYSILMNERSRRHFWEGQGPLSLKTVLQGEASYEVKAKNFKIDKNRFLVLNDFQNYKIHIDSPYPTETFIVFFNRNLIQDVTHTFLRTEKQLLDHASEIVEHPVNFFLQTSPMTPELMSAIHELKILQTTTTDPLQLQEKLYALFRLLLIHDFKKENGVLNGNTASHQEIRKRLASAIDYMHASYQSPITLDT